MKNFLLPILILSGILLTFSCSKDNDNKVIDKFGENKEIVITTGISKKATDTNWEFGDAIGVTVYNMDYTSIIGNQFNKKYVTTEQLGIFNAASGSEIVYFPQTGDSIQIKSYYPYLQGASSNMLYTVSVADQTTLQHIDLMTAEHQSGYTTIASDVHLRFYHRLCKLIFVLTPEDESDQISLADCNLTMYGFDNGNTYDLFNDVFMDMKNGVDSIQVPLRANESENMRQAIVMPRAAGEGISFEFVTPAGATYKANMSSNLALEPGFKYTFNIVLSKNPVTVTATIEDWLEGSNSNLIAQ